MSFNSYVLSYGADDVLEQEAAGNDVIEVHTGNMVEHRKVVNQIPNLGLRVSDGWLVGSDRGEWGGELAFIPDTDKPQIILRENVEDIYYLGKRTVATTGLAHLGLNSGAIYSLFRDENKKWQAEPWIQLPSAPETSWFVETGELLVNLYVGGSILISESGKLRMAPCAVGS